MVWSHDDFIRELSRQLVELETLRKKLEGPGDPGEIIERIAAHRSAEVYLRSTENRRLAVRCGRLEDNDRTVEEIARSTLDMVAEDEVTFIFPEPR